MKKLLTLAAAATTIICCTAATAAPSSGIASYYGKGFHGKRAADGSIFNQHALTCASNIHKMGSKLKVTNPRNGKSVIVRVTDRGGFGKYGRTLDLSQGAFSRIAPLGQGVARVNIQKIS